MEVQLRPLAVQVVQVITGWLELRLAWLSGEPDVAQVTAAPDR